MVVHSSEIKPGGGRLRGLMPRTVLGKVLLGAVAVAVFGPLSWWLWQQLQASALPPGLKTLIAGAFIIGPELLIAVVGWVMIRRRRRRVEEHGGL